ncbi:polysaccharide biosynthesis tyrosine autokinase [Amylibacter sp.]|nr:polysaccharide biosynthesis tyrosine autokinase [Amylibacter sp.]
MKQYNENTKDSDEIDLLRLYGILFINKYKIFFVTALTTLFGLTFSYIKPPSYQADSLIQIEEKSNGSIGISTEISELLGATAPVTVSEIEILNSRMILLKVVNNLDLDKIAKPKRLPIIGNFLTRYSLPDPGWDYIKTFAWNEESIKLGSLSVPTVFLGKDITLKILQGKNFSIQLGASVPIIGEVGKIVKDIKSGFSITIDKISGQPGREFIIKQSDPLNVVRKLKQNISITERGKKSSILELKYKSTDKYVIEDILNEIANVYLLQNLNRSVAEAESSLKFIQKQIPKAELKLEVSEKALNTFQLSQDSVDLTFETRSLLEASVNISSELNLITLQERELEKKYTKNHPLYKSILDKKSQLEMQLKKVNLETNDLPKIQQKMLSLKQDVELARGIYLQLITRSQELSIIKAGTISNIRILDKAVTSPNPVSPNRKLICILSTLLGLMLSSILILAKTFYNKGIMRPEDIEELNIPVYATVNKISKNFNTNVSEKKTINILANIDPTHLAVEALRGLRTRLHFGLLGSEKNSVSITSARPGEGKSFISINLATVAALSGQKVCLIDTDMRRGYLNKYFNVSKKSLGLSDVISGNAKIEDVIIQDSNSDLFFLPSGMYPPNPSELLMSSSFEKVVNYLNENFELSIFDTPPILAVTDPIIISKYVGMSLLVVQYEKTTSDEINNVISTFDKNELSIKGAVLNGYDVSRNPYGYGYGAYQYQYSYSSRK